MPYLPQVYCTFSNVTVQVQASKQGAPPRFRLVPAPAPTTPTTTSTFSGAATTSGAAGCGHEAACGSGGGSGDGGGFPTPVCMAVVAAWADGGSLATALERTGFLRVPPATSGSGSSGGGGGGGGVNPLSRPRSGPFELKVRNARECLDQGKPGLEHTQLHHTCCASNLCGCRLAPGSSAVDQPLT